MKITKAAYGYIYSARRYVLVAPDCIKQLKISFHGYSQNRYSPYITPYYANIEVGLWSETVQYFIK